MKEALFYRSDKDGTVSCLLCPQACRIADGAVGLCHVRENRGGTLLAKGYGELSSVGVDPIEKKPLYHFRPGSRIFSVGGWGCNLSCRFCQNWRISQCGVVEGRSVAPAALMDEVVRDGCGAVAYTYNEPLVGFEFVTDCARLARQRGLANVLVTNGFVNPKPARELLPYIDAVNLDIKSMDDAFYRTYCGGRLDPVLAFADEVAARGVHIEVTNLLIPGLNDGSDAVLRLADWVCVHLGALTPLHLSAYHPQYRMDYPATPLDTLMAAHETACGRLRYVYLGNVSAAIGRDTNCPGCGACLIARAGYVTRNTGIEGGRCRACGRTADVRL